jgi:hypothetical protein
MNRITTILCALALVCFAGTAMAELDIGGDIKVLGFYGENVADFNDDGSTFGFDDQDDFIRTEVHLFFQADLSDNVTTKVSLEADRDWDYDTESFDDDFSRVIPVSESDLEIFLEEAWIKMAYIYDSAFNVTIGRQFIEFGDGFVVGDSSPGSEMFLLDKGEYEVDPFDAIHVAYDGDDWILNLLYAKVLETRVVDEDADVYGAYFSYMGWEDYVLDLYFLMHNTETAFVIPTGAPAPGVWTWDNFDAEVYALGARFAGTPMDGLSFKLEGVYEFGDIQPADMDIKAWALEAGVKYMFDADYNPFLAFTYVYESGDDDPADDDYETYLSLFENRTYGEIFDPWTSSNIHIFNLGGGFDINEELAFSAQYYYFMLDEEDAWGADDEEAGHEIDAYLDYQFSEETSAMVAAGVFMPEDAVEDRFGDDDAAWFVRAGVKVEF